MGWTQRNGGGCSIAMVTTATDPDGSVSLDGLTLRTPGIRGAVSVERIAPPDASAREAPPRAPSGIPWTGRSAGSGCGPTGT